jgi:adenylosuccinate lyase
MLKKTADLVSRLVVNEDKMLSNMDLSMGLVYSQHIMLELIKKGATRMDAYDMIQSSALKAGKEKRHFKELLLEDEKVKGYMSPDDIEKCFSLDYHLRHIDKIFKNIGL